MNNSQRKLPAAVDVEKEILGGIIFESESLPKIAAFLKPFHFFNSKHRLIYKAMIMLFNSGVKIDTVSIYQALSRSKELEVIGEKYLFTLSDETISTANIEYHSAVVIEKWIARELIKQTNSIVDKVYAGDQDIFDLISESSTTISQIIVDIDTGSEDHDLGKNLPSILDDISKRKEKTDDNTIKSSCFPSFNKLTGGLIPKTMISLSGKDKQGKTTFAYKLALDFAINKNIPVGIFSLEMSDTVLAWKALSLESGIDYMRIRNPRGWDNQNKLSDSDYQQLESVAESKFAASKIFTCDKVLNELQIKVKMKNWIRKYGVKFFVVDYIGLIQSSMKHDTREREISYLSRFFKLVSTELDTIILILSQQNRQGELAESKGLERDPDFAFTIEKPIDQGRKQIKINNTTMNLTDDHFLCTLKRSRHGRQGRQFLLGYQHNNFVEINMSHTNIHESRASSVSSYYDKDADELPI